MHSVNQIRSSFLEHFRKQGHEVVSSSPLVPHNDPTLMFTNAGMVQFKDVFTQNETRQYKRAASSQKCVRAGGKHNDLDNVGYTARHHTFFEMLGNFSFGDYFKEGAIEYAWEFLTFIAGIPKDKLLVTVYHTDDEAFDLWKKIAGLPDDKIIRIPTSDNFWSMGDTGPCGPCSEIFFDHGEKIPGGPPGSKDENGDRFIEIWNLVFMQYEQLASGERINLPAPSIDTGMGLERIAAVLQGVHDNYDIDLFKSLIELSKEFTGNDDPALVVSHRVVADHLRAMGFLLADGVMPSNEGRGYVLRRIMRRAMRHARQLGAREPLLYRLVPGLVKEMGEAYPELVRAQPFITEIIKLEEERFGLTIDRGLKLLDEETGKLESPKHSSPVCGVGGEGAPYIPDSQLTLPGEVAFKLYDTYGFPLDLTIDILRSRNIAVDEAGFSAAMAEQKTRARAAWKGSGAKATDEIWFDIKESGGATEFLGYEVHEAQAVVVAIIQDGARADSTGAGETVTLILNQTPFYAESGGQQGDYGIISADGLEIQVTDTQKYLGVLHGHIGKIINGMVKTGDTVHAQIDTARRERLVANHSATHILHAVLRNVLGNHVTQKGSQVAQDRFRLDISHPKSLEPEELVRIEAEVNRIIRQNTAICTRVMPHEEAVSQGAMALFGEKYGDEVRVVSMGDALFLRERADNSSPACGGGRVGADAGSIAAPSPHPNPPPQAGEGTSRRPLQEGGAPYSVELCGGTHVKRTGDIGLFKIISEGAIAAGVRRIEAVTADAALAYVNAQVKSLSDIAAKLKCSIDAVPARIDSLLSERKKLEKDYAEARKAASMGNGGTGAAAAEEINGTSFIGRAFDDVQPKDLRDIAADMQKNLSSGIIVLASSFEGKASIIITVSDDLTARISAVDLIKIAAEILGAKGGGGKPNFAQTGGPEGGKITDAVDSVRKAVALLLSS